MSFYLDASAILPTLLAEIGSPAMDRFLDSCVDAIFVSDFAAAEVASALSRQVRNGELSPSDAADCLADFDTWRASITENVDLQAADARMASVMVRRFSLGLRAPDALHVAICRRTGHKLVTLDRKLARAAQELGVEVVVPEA